MPRKSKPLKPSPQELATFLADINRYHRQEAFYAYSCYDPDLSALPTLRKALRDSEFSVVRSAAISIGKLGPHAAEAVNDLMRAAGRSPEWESGFDLPQAYSDCLKALLLVGAPPDQIIELIHSHFGHPNWDYPRDSLHVLKRLGTPQALRLLSRIVAFWWPELHRGQRAYVEKHFPEAVPKAVA